MATKASPFFSSSHNQILQQKMIKESPKIDIKIDDYATKASSDCSQINRECYRLDEKSVSLPLQETGHDLVNKGSPDSGIGTPLSPQKTGTEPHPLSNCDVQFTYNGTKELKNIKSLRNMTRNSSPDLIGK